uniref:Uncharacterized protein n=1 Tax=Apteryx owenii TaxID=8824 RepID=A0A8B9NZT9_APTOW
METLHEATEIPTGAGDPPWGRGDPHHETVEVLTVWYPARQSLRLDPKPARGHHGHLLLPGPGRADQLGDGV